mmetsp:Transcript_10755/g.25530  ORF Transcript_10755/g.25530 Transcript_10755/m.25530 type:complete len:411 (-) Transcript_10755:1583-2815(-)
MNSDDARVVNVADGLLREYLHKLGCKRALQVFDEERPRHAESITSRTELRKVLGLDKLAARLKKENPGASLPPTLEMWVGSQLEKLDDGRAPQSAAGSASSKARRPKPMAAEAESPEPAMESTPEGNARGRRSSRPTPVPMQDVAAAPMGMPKAGFGAPATSGSALFGSAQKRTAAPAARQRESIMMEDVEDLEADSGHAPPPALHKPSRRLGGGFSGENLSADQVAEQLFAPPSQHSSSPNRAVAPCGKEPGERERGVLDCCLSSVSFALVGLAPSFTEGRQQQQEKGPADLTCKCRDGKTASDEALHGRQPFRGHADVPACGWLFPHAWQGSAPAEPRARGPAESQQESCVSSSPLHPPRPPNSPCSPHLASSPSAFREISWYSGPNRNSRNTADGLHFMRARHAPLC